MVAKFFGMFGKLHVIYMCEHCRYIFFASLVNERLRAHAVLFFAPVRIEVNCSDRLLSSADGARCQISTYVPRSSSTEETMSIWLPWVPLFYCLSPSGIDLQVYFCLLLDVV